MLSTRNVKESAGTGRINSKMGPGNVTAKINSVELTEGYNHANTGAYNLVLNMETQPIGPEFEGFLLNKDNPNGGRYLGQVGRVKFQYHSFEDGVTKTGIQKNRDNDILNAVTRIANALGLREDLDNTVDAAAISRIEELPAIATQVFRGKYLDLCVAGRGYKDKGGYTAYELFLPYPRQGKISYEAAGAKSGNLYAFTETAHIIAPKEDKPVTSFEPMNNNDFDL
jgi:hypothetical protein